MVDTRSLSSGKRSRDPVVPASRLDLRLHATAINSRLPACQHSATEAMPTDACQFFYDCKGCGQRLKPKPGDCCVFCSFGSVPCPPVQQNGKCY